ncbi:hypothetical protein LTR37_016953, partial [Vermiconidia calcicola]
YFINYVDEALHYNGNEDALAARFLAGAQGAFALGRFVGVFFMQWIRPRWVFLFFLTMCMVFIAPSITQRGFTGMSMLYVTLFFESICFPTIVALGMRGLGKHSKRGSGWIVAGVCGGAVVPPLLGVAADARSTPFAMVVPLCFFIAAYTYALAVNFVPAYRTVADKFSTTKIGVEKGAGTGKDEESGSPIGGEESDKIGAESREVRMDKSL